MSNFIYNFLEKIGYTHPMHPVLVHMPIGLVVAAFFLSCSAYLFRRPSFATSAYHALVVAFIFYFPSVLMGLIDWQRYYHGAWLTPIKIKLIFAPILFLLLTPGVFIGYRQGTQSRPLFVIYLLSLVTVTILGYFGGQLTFGGRSPKASAEFAAGQKLFEANCSGCHAHGGNVLKPSLPLRSAKELQTRNGFVDYLRDPTLPNGKQGEMPSFSRDDLSDTEATKLYDYIQRYIALPEPNNS